MTQLVQQEKYPNVSSLRILGNMTYYERPAYLHTFFEECLLFDNLVQLTLCYPCMMNRQLYLTLLERSPNLIILNIDNYEQLLQLTNTYRHRCMCSVLQKQIKKLTLNNGPIDWNDKFLQTFSNLNMFTYTYGSVDELYLIVPKLLNDITKLILVRFKSANRRRNISRKFSYLGNKEHAND
jgi:hypothetical protein